MTIAQTAPQRLLVPIIGVSGMVTGTAAASGGGGGGGDSLVDEGGTLLVDELGNELIDD